MVKKLIFNSIYSTLTSIRDGIKDQSDAILAKYDLGFTDNLDQIGTFLGIPRRVNAISRVQNRYISIYNSLGLATFSITIPAGTKFYLTDDIYLYTTIDQQVTQDTLIDAIFNIDIDNAIGILDIATVSSTNTELLDYTFKTCRIINPSDSTESNEVYAGRIVQKMSLKSFSNKSKLDFVLKTLNITNYFINNQLSLPGTTEVVISPPEMSRFDEYKQLVIDSMLMHLGDDASTRIIIKSPTIRRLEITNYDSLTDDGATYIDNLELGANISIDMLRSYYGSNANFILDGVAMTSNVQLNNYDKVQLYIISVG